MAAHDPLQPHRHDPNPEPPSVDPTFTLVLPDGKQRAVSVESLQALPHTSVDNCFIVSTGHGTSGPFHFGGVALLDLVLHYYQGPWTQIEVISADGFGNRVWRKELEEPASARPILLAYLLDGRKLERREGLVRLIVPGETDDALRQVKWIETVRVRQ